MELLHRSISRRRAAQNILVAGSAGLMVASLAKGAGQPHMEAALKALNNAAADLQQAADDKAGHRANAIKLVSQAINQVQQGIAAGASK